MKRNADYVGYLRDNPRIEILIEEVKRCKSEFEVVILPLYGGLLQLDVEVCENFNSTEFDYASELQDEEWKLYTEGDTIWKTLLLPLPESPIKSYAVYVGLVTEFLQKELAEKELMSYSDFLREIEEPFVDINSI